ncbi:hypothetical protein M422DRAFT_775824 [Sphaerobolus stellatus SS14]|nr:hypothetical protein M422DRAFT_775824 [Sphaerobolus stellatus SS14]
MKIVAPALLAGAAGVAHDLLGLGVAKLALAVERLTELQRENNARYFFIGGLACLCTQQHADAKALSATSDASALKEEIVLGEIQCPESTYISDDTETSSPESDKEDFGAENGQQFVSQRTSATSQDVITPQRASIVQLTNENESQNRTSLPTYLPNHTTPRPTPHRSTALRNA